MSERGDCPGRMRESIVARDGTVLEVRPLGPQDLALERDLLGRISPESMRQRLLGAVTRIDDAQLAQGLQPGWPGTLALGALRRTADGEELLGVARFSSDADARQGAEFAIVVADRWQRRGIGHALFDCLVRAGRAAGYRELWGTTFADNLHMIELARSHGFDVGPEPGEPSLRRLTLRL